MYIIPFSALYLCYENMFLFHEEVLHSSVLLHPVLSLNELDFNPEAVSDTLSVLTLTRISLQGSSVLKAVTEKEQLHRLLFKL